MSKDYEQQQQDLFSGLAQIDKVIMNPKNRVSYLRAVQSREIQLARIQFFKQGYQLRNKEIKEQSKL